jgi:hypothetical protein
MGHLPHKLKDRGSRKILWHLSQAQYPIPATRQGRLEFHPDRPSGRVRGPLSAGSASKARLVGQRLSRVLRALLARLWGVNAALAAVVTLLTVAGANRLTRLSRQRRRSAADSSRTAVFRRAGVRLCRSRETLPGSPPRVRRSAS